MLPNSRLSLFGRAPMTHAKVQTQTRSATLLELLWGCEAHGRKHCKRTQGTGAGTPPWFLAMLPVIKCRGKHYISSSWIFYFTYSVTAWFLCKTWPFQTCISASTVHLFYFCLKVIGSTAICPFQLPIKSHSANSSYKEEKWFIRFQTTNVEIDKTNNEANKKNAIERKITLILPYQESNGSSMVGTQGLSRAVCENSCLTDVNELFVHKSTGKSVPKGMQRTPIRAHDPCYPNWSAGNMGTSHALCKEQAVTTRRLRKGCTSRIGKAGHLGVGHGCA